MQRFGRRDKMVAIFAAVGVLAAVVVSAVVVVRWRSDADSARPPDSRATREHPVRNDGANPLRTGRTLVIPHGGGDGMFPEDTLLAYVRTIAMGADVVDVDLRLSKDDVVVAFHDATVDRITGTPGSIRAMTFDQLAGSTPAGRSAPPAAIQRTTARTRTVARTSRSRPSNRSSASSRQNCCRSTQR